MTGFKTLATIDIYNIGGGEYRYEARWQDMDGAEHQHAGMLMHDRRQDIMCLLAEMIRDIADTEEGGAT
jgi:hypothetical protein